MSTRNGSQLTEPEAWRLIAERIANGEWGRRGLCWELWNSTLTQALHKSRLIYPMDHRLSVHVAVHKWRYQFWYVFPPGQANVRVLAALFLALEAEGE